MFYNIANFQTKLNCEILDDAKAFEVRWAIAGKSIVTQLVARFDLQFEFISIILNIFNK